MKGVDFPTNTSPMHKHKGVFLENGCVSSPNMLHHLIISDRDYKSAFSPVLFILSHCQNFQYLLYYYQYAGVSHHTAEMICDIVALPPRRHQCHRSCASFRCYYFFWTDFYRLQRCACIRMAVWHDLGQRQWRKNESRSSFWQITGGIYWNLHQ